MEGDTTFGDGRETNIQRKSQEEEAADITSVTFFTREELCRAPSLDLPFSE